MEQTGVVPIVRVAKQLRQPCIDGRAVDQRKQAPFIFDAPTLADAQEDNSVYRALNRVVERMDIKPFVA